jgi:hypothetical protein
MRLGQRQEIQALLLGPAVQPSQAFPTLTINRWTSFCCSAVNRAGGQSVS